MDKTQNASEMILRLLDMKAIMGSVLEIGCGTGGNSLHISGDGYPALGIDSSAEKIAVARQNAQLMLARRGICARFKLCGIFHLETLSELFFTIIDSGKLQSLNPEEGKQYLHSILKILEPSGSLILLLPQDGVVANMSTETEIHQWIRGLVEPYFSIDSLIFGSKGLGLDEKNPDHAVILKKETEHE